MKLLRLEAENVNRLKLVAIEPDGTLTVISGDNEQGKSSLLNCIWWALAGTANVHRNPIRDGEEEARIRLELGERETEIIVLREFSRKDSSYTTKLTVTNGQGAKFGSPQAMLDALLGSLAFDPLAFARAKPAEQLAMLKKFVSGFDFDKADADIKRLYDKRTDVNRREKEARARVAGIVVPPNTPAEKVDSQDLLNRINAAMVFNRNLVTEESRRRDQAERLADLRRQAEALRFELAKVIELGKALNAEVEAWTPLASPMDTSPLTADLKNLEAINEAVGARQRREVESKAMHALGGESADLSKSIEAIEESKRVAIREANLPVDGLGFGDGFVTLDDLPFDQAASSKQLRVSTALGMAAHAKLRLMIVRDGSLLDNHGMALLAAMCEEFDYQCITERVQDSSGVGVRIVIEDGMVKQ